MAEPDASRSFPLGPSANIDIKTETAQRAVNDMAAAMKGLEKALQDFGNNAYSIADKINRHLKTIGDTAAKVSGQLAGVGAAVSGVTGTTGNTANTAAAATSRRGAPVFGADTTVGKSAAWAQNAASSASAAIARVVDKDIVGGLSLGTFVGTGGGEGISGFTKDLALAPLRYLRSRINTNRDTAIMASGGLNMQAIQQGVGTGSMMDKLAKFPGSIYGTPQDLVQMFGAAPALGASYAFGGASGPLQPGQRPQGQGVRAAGFFKGIQEMQKINPMAQVGGAGGLVSQLGEYSANTGAQQRSMMLTGGAMGMIAAGGRQKSLTEWAESILRWFEGLRPGKDRGKGFNYGSLMAQYFPGSNIDAWFQVNGVPQNMRDYWWTYALGKASRTTDTLSKFDAAEVIAPQENNVAWQRLRAGSELTRTEFSLAGKMSPQYAKRESSNRWFNELIGQVQETIIPALSDSIFAWIQYLPDSIEDLLMTGTERGMSALLGDTGDVGDIGDSYGAVGGTGLSGLHPDMKKKVGNMMKANPRLRMTSGLRDTGLQRKLRASGNTNVSGKPSAHTRGMAADLGPRSEYGWIQRNAKKFGLASGKNHGEPWHVGMPGDISGVGDAFTDFIDDIKGFASTPEGMAGFITKLMDKMVGGINKLTGAGKAEGEFAASPEDLYQRLALKSKNVTIGLPVTTHDPGFGHDEIEGTLDPIRGGSGGGGSFQDKMKEKLAKLGGTTTLPTGGGPGSQEAGLAAATALFNAGFRKKEDLETITAISWRESKWNPLAKNPSTSDRGLMQINMSAHKAQMQAMGYTEADLLDIQKNANFAYRMWSQGGGDYDSFQQLWGFSESSPWLHGQPGWDRDGDPLGRTQGSNAAQIVQASGLPVGDVGDVESMRAGLNLTSSRGSGTNVVFNNSFTIGAVSPYDRGSSGGIDVRRTVTLIADHLEDEMKRRVARTA